MGNIAIVGMDAFFGGCDGLDAFDHTIYDGKQQFISVPLNRWKGIEDRSKLLEEYGFGNGQVPDGAYIQDFEMDFLHYKAPPKSTEQPIPQERLMVKVADRALKDAGIQEGERVAVIITVEAIAHDRLKVDGEVSQKIGNIGKAIACRISSLWNFSGSAFTRSPEANSVFKALEVAQIMLEQQEVDAVMVGAVDLADGVENALHRNTIARINTGTPTLGFDCKSNGWIVGEGAGAVVLKHIEQAKQAQNRIYAVIDAVSSIQENVTPEATSSPYLPSSQTITQSCQQAFSAVGILPDRIGYLEVFASGIEQEDAAEVAGLLQAYQTNQDELSCAIGSIKANIGHTYAASGIASLIKTALCVYHQYIPGTPQWSSPKQPEKWQGSPFYVPIHSTPWFLAETTPKRIAAISGFGLDRTCTHLILSEEINQIDRSSKYLEQTPFYLFPLTAPNQGLLLEQLQVLQQTVEHCTSLAIAANQVFVTFQRQSQVSSRTTYTIAIVGRNQDELTTEIQWALKGVPQAFEQKIEWSTPSGSHFTTNPLGKQGGIAFVYPGAFTSYLDQFRDTYRLFPVFYDTVNKISNQEKKALYAISQKLYPRSLHRLSPRQLEFLESELMNDATMMLISGIVASKISTMIIQDYFKVKPQAAFGYSLAELSMMFALNVYTNTNHLLESLKSYPLFKTRLSGPKNVVRDYWGLPQSQEPSSEDFWNIYVLIAPPAKVIECLKSEPRVYLTNINTEKEVVIAGDKQGCLRAIERLQCDYLRAPVSHVLHCEPMNSEYGELVKWLSLPINKQPALNFYSAAEYDYAQLESQTIAHNIAKALCQPLDFPRLIDRVYEDGVRFFLELGAGNTCTRWIRETLKHKEHIALAIDNRGIPNHTSIIRALAKLVSHQVDIDLSPLYCQIQENLSSQKPLVKALATSPPLPVNSYSTEIHSHKLHENLHRLTRNHAIFLQSRQESLQQIGQLIHQQIAISEQILAASKPTNIIFNEAEILEIARGKISRVFGKKYEEIDAYPRCTRVPMPPYLFITRVTKLDAKLGSFEPCSIETEYDVPHDAWYLMGNQVPWGISIEVFQSNIFLASYLGVDLEFKGKRVYRVLGGKVTFMGETPQSGDTLRCIVKITSFSRFDNTLIFSYTYEGFVGDRLFVGGQASSGLFSDEELNKGQGIILNRLEQLERSKAQKQYFQPLLHCDKTAFSEEDILQLSKGNFADCFGSQYEQQGRNPLLTLPNSPIRMLDRVTSIDRTGGAWGLGLITAEKDLNPEDWYFNCHFKDDYCMPGSTISEGCIQLILFYMMYLGLQTRMIDAKLQPCPNLVQTVRYRGQITPISAIITYQIEVTEIGLQPTPYVKADTFAIFKGNIIYMAKNLGVQLSERA